MLNFIIHIQTTMKLFYRISWQQMWDSSNNIYNNNYYHYNNAGPYNNNNSNNNHYANYNNYSNHHNDPNNNYNYYNYNNTSNNNSINIWPCNQPQRPLHMQSCWVQNMYVRMDRGRVWQFDSW